MWLKLIINMTMGWSWTWSPDNISQTLQGRLLRCQEIDAIRFYCTPLHLAQSTNCMPPYMLFAKRTPTVKARATGGTCFASGDASMTRSRPLITWYRVLEETPRKTPKKQTMYTSAIRKHTNLNIFVVSSEEPHETKVIFWIVQYIRWEMNRQIQSFSNVCSYYRLKELGKWMCIYVRHK